MSEYDKLLKRADRVLKYDDVAYYAVIEDLAAAIRKLDGIRLHEENMMEEVRLLRARVAKLEAEPRVRVRQGEPPVPDWDELDDEGEAMAAAEYPEPGPLRFAFGVGWRSAKRYFLLAGEDDG